MLRSTGLLVLLACFWQVTAATKPNQLPPRYKTWLTQDVVYLITEEERKNFLTLPSDDARDEFIEQFWDIRNPSSHGTRRNPYKEEHYKRIEYANAHFGRQSNTPGWMTDMGRAYIQFGKPTSQHAFTGYGQIYPLDLWFYENDTGNPSLPPFFYVLFYIADDIGEYKFYKPGFDGPLKLVRGSNFNSNRDVYNFLKPLGGDIAHAAFSLVPNDPLDTTDFHPDMGSDILVNKILNFPNDTFNVRKIRALRSMREKVSSYLLVADQKPLDINAIVLSDPLGQYWLDYSVLIDNAMLGAIDPVTGQLKLSISYRLLTDKGELIVEDAEESAYTALDGSAEKRFQPFQVGNRLPLVTGSYRLEVQVFNRAAGKTFKGEQKVTAGPTKQLSIGVPLLASSVDRVARPDPATPFQYFGVQFHPVAARSINQREPIRLLFELQQPESGPAQELQIEYVLAHIHNREQRRTLTDTIAPERFQNGRLLMSKTIPIAELEPGDYRLVVNVKPTASAEVVLSSNLPIKVDNERNDAPLFFLANSRSTAAPGVAPYIRALEAVAQKDNSAATNYLKQALTQNPANSLAGQYLVQLYFNGRNFAPVTALYKRLGITPFQASPETLAEISLSFWQTGEKAQARELLQTAQTYFPKNPLLTATATNLR